MLDSSSGEQSPKNRPFPERGTWGLDFESGRRTDDADRLKSDILNEPMLFDIDRYIGLWRSAEGFVLAIEKVDEEHALASLYTPVGPPIARPYFDDKASIDMPATYDDYEGTMTVQLWRDESGFTLELIHEPAYEMDEFQREALVPALSRYETDTFLDQYYDLFGKLLGYTRHDP